MLRRGVVGSWGRDEGILLGAGGGGRAGATFGCAGDA